MVKKSADETVDQEFTDSDPQAMPAMAIADDERLPVDSILVPIEPQTPLSAPPIRRLDLKGTPKDAETWLADAKEQERVLMLGDHVSPVRTAELMLEAIPVIEGLVTPPPPADADEAKKRK
jgi:hypothetical protein